MYGRWKDADWEAILSQGFADHKVGVELGARPMRGPRGGLADRPAM